MTIKQSNQGLRVEIQTDGCLFMSLLDIACDVAHRDMDPEAVNRIYMYVVPHWMKDGGHVMSDRCYVLDHTAIIRAGLDWFGLHDWGIEYKYRRDGDIIKMGAASDWLRCNYWITKIKLPTFSHFYRSGPDSTERYNPGISMSNHVLSLRGYNLWQK